MTVYEPSSRYAFKVTAGPVRPAEEFRFVAAGGRTEVTFSLGVQLSGVKKVFMSAPVKRSMDGEMRSLDTAKMLIECA